MEIVSALVGFVLGAALVGLYLNKKNANLLVEAQTWKTKSELLESTYQESKSSSTQMQNTLTLQFKDLAQKIFDEKLTKLELNTTKTSDQNLKQIESLLNPLRDRIKDFEKKVEDTYSTERLERGNLKHEITKLLEINQSMSKEAHNLAVALKGDNKSQGNWGELILENILERSGLRKGEEYFTQETLKGSEGQTLRPDVIVQLPDGKHLIVDSKMTLVAYESYVSCVDDAQKDKFASAHVDSLREHIKGLSEKKYHLAEKIITPDFVMLFMPLEPAFALAFKLKAELFENAWDRNVAIVSPTTLLTTLRTVASLWKQERQQQNALEIAKRGGELYDKFVGIVADIEKLGAQISTVQKTHDEVFKKISTGKNNLLTQVERLKELGAKADKQLPAPNEEA
jgi:DNA recombination protein RmuC